MGLIPSIAPGVSDGIVWMYYGNGAAESVADRAATFDTSTTAAFHFGESAGFPIDATGYAHAETQANITLGSPEDRHRRPVCREKPRAYQCELHPPGCGESRIYLVAVARDGALGGPAVIVHAYVQCRRHQLVYEAGFEYRFAKR